MRKVALLVVLVAIGLLSCTHQESKSESFGFEQRHYGVFEAPVWLQNIPKGDFAIGIAWDDASFSSGAIDIAKEFAAVSLSRNRGSFVVDKSIVTAISEQQALDWNQVGYNLVVSADTDFLRRAGRELKLIDKYSTGAYLICLFGFGESAVSADRVAMSRQNLPDWCNREDIAIQGDKLISVASAQHATLMDAWSEAQEKALRQIGKYRLQKVMGRLTATQSSQEKAIAIETVTKSQSNRFVNAFVVPIRNNNTLSYKVYICLGTNP